MSVMHGRRAGLDGLRNEHAERAIEIRTSGNERTCCSNSWCSGGIALGELSSRPVRQLL